MLTIIKYTVLITISLFTSCSANTYSERLKTEDQSVELTNWQYFGGNNFAGPTDWKPISSLSEVPHQPGRKSILLRTQLPEWRGTDQCIYIGQSDHCFQVYLNRRLIYQMGDTSSYNKTNFIGWNQNLIGLPDFKQGDTLIVQIWTTGNSTGIAGKIILGSYGKIINNVFNQNYIDLLFAIVFFVTGIIALIIHLNFRKTKLLLGIAYYLIPVSVLFVVNSLFIQIIANAPTLYYHLDYISLISTTAGGFFLIEFGVIKKYKKILRCLWKIQLGILAVVILIINLSGITSVEIYPYFFIILIINMLISFSVMILSAKTGESESRLFTAGMSGVLFFAILEIILYFIYGTNSGEGYHFRVIYLGILWFVAVLIKIVIERYKSADRQKEILQQNELEAINRENEARELFAMKLIESQENERNRIALELHDSVGQKLLLIKNQVISEIRTEKEGGSSELLIRISNLTSEAINEIRNISHNLRPQHLDQLGLTTAIETLIENVEELTDIKFHTSIENIDDMIQHENEINIYRIVQESINNIVKHSMATDAYIKVEKKVNMIYLEIKDNGTGKKPEIGSRLSGIGLRGMYERARMSGAKLNLDFSKGTGTIVSLEYEIINE